MKFDKTFFAYGYEVPKKGKQYLVDRLNHQNEENNELMRTSVVKKVKKVDEGVYILYTCNSRYIVRLLR